MTAAADTVPKDRALVRQLWPVLLASALSLVPFTVFGSYLVAIAASGGWDVSVVGGMRGLGGVAALVVGVLLAPLLDRVPRGHAAAFALVLLGLAAALGTVPSIIALAAFCLLIGTATAILNPALTAMAADTYADGASAGRAATLVSATQSMTAMLAAPVVALPAMVWGWRAPLLGVGVAAAACAVLLVRRRGTTAEATSPRYLAAFRGVLGDRRAALLLTVSLLRTAAFMGWLAYVAAFYDQRFGLPPEVFTLVWTLSGAAFFLGNLFAGKLLSRVEDGTRIGWIAVAGCLAGAAAQALLVSAPVLPVALVGTAVLAAAHAVVAACVTTLLVRGSDTVRGTTLALNGAAQSLGVFGGAAIAGVGLAYAQWTGVGATLSILTLAGALAAAIAIRRKTTA